ncbi:MAG: hypothetical protein ACSHX9_12815 [Luteolibacter sp.]
MSPLRKIRILTAFVIVGLVISGVTAFPLLRELNLLANFFVDAEGSMEPAGYSGLAHWILLVRKGLEDTYAAYPFIAYGTDWLAFGHIVIALFFVPAYREPVRYQGVFRVGIWAALLIFPLAFICGEIRGIPIYWRLLDCLFGVVAMVPLFYILSLVRKIESEGLNS